MKILFAEQKEEIMKCCDRCKKPIDRRDNMQIKFKWNFREFIRNIDISVQRRREGIEDSSYYHKTASGTWDLCRDCNEKLAEFLLNEEKNSVTTQ